MFNPLKHLPPWRVRLTAKDLKPLYDRVNTLSKLTASGGTHITTGPTGIHIRGGGEATDGEAKQYAIVVRSLQRADPTTTPVTEEISCYKIKPTTETDYDDWYAWHGTYSAGDKVYWTDGLDYQCLITHTASDAKDPDNDAYWSCISPDAYILGYPYTNLIGTIPWLKVGSEVEVVVKGGTYNILETASRVEEEGDNGELYTSMQWNTDEWRAMAVYK